MGLWLLSLALLSLSPLSRLLLLFLLLLLLLLAALVIVVAVGTASVPSIWSLRVYSLVLFLSASYLRISLNWSRLTPSVFPEGWTAGQRRNGYGHLRKDPCSKYKRRKK